MVHIAEKIMKSSLTCCNRLKHQMLSTACTEQGRRAAE